MVATKPTPLISLSWPTIQFQNIPFQNLFFTSIYTLIGWLHPLRFLNSTLIYSFQAGTDHSSAKRSTPISAFFTTREGVPGSLTSFEIIDVRPSLITFGWQLPSRLQANGVITGFTIVWGVTPTPDRPFREIGSREFGPTETQGTITGLTPGEEYTFQIKAETKVGFGPKETKTRRMPILAPPVPVKDVFPTEMSRSMHTITIRYRQNYFSDENGKVQGYTIIVAEDHNVKTQGTVRLPSWRDVQRHSTWPPYQVSITPTYPFNNTLVDGVEDFTIGTDEECLKHHGYCNGPLRPGTLYRFKVLRI